MKKFICILAMSVLILSTMGVTVSARGRHGRNVGDNAQLRYTLCTESGCEIIGSHEHDGKIYCDQSGKTIDCAVCAFDGCTEVGLHEHNGEYYRSTLYGRGNELGRGNGRNCRQNR